MCGILGRVGRAAVTPPARLAAQRGLEALRPRGPDGARLVEGEDWVLGHARLAILDLTERAAQPMQSPRGSWLVYNGEIYNFQELRAELIQAGHNFQSTGDTEVLLVALEHWGEKVLPRLRGMFAFAWLDPQVRRLLLVRDRWGVKPLVWEPTEDGIAFASDLFALDAMTEKAREIDPESVRDYLLLGYVPTPRTIWRGPQKLRPGHCLAVDWSQGGSVQIQQSSYWSMANVPCAGELDAAQSEELFWAKTREAVQLRLISDVPVGILLSGGLDSTLVAAACAQSPGSRTPTFVMGFAQDATDERAAAQETALRLGLPCEEFVAEEADLAVLFDDLWRTYDEPFADSSALPTLLLCRAMRQRVKVALGGDGGDEVWLGYPWHRALARVERYWQGSAWVRGAVSSFLALVPAWRERARILGAKDRETAWTYLKTGLSDGQTEWLPVRGARRQPLSALFGEATETLGEVPNLLDWAGRMDLLTYLPDNLMVKIDRASMATGLELREPLLDHELTVWGLQQKIDFRFDRESRLGKQPARKLLSALISPETVTRPKRGFTPPLVDWLEGALNARCQSAIAELEAGELGPVQLPVGLKTWDEVADKLEDKHHQFLWRVVCFAGWYRARVKNKTNAG